MLDRLIYGVDHLGHWGYLIVFLVVMLECQAFMGLALPGETLVVMAGFLAGQGIFRPGLLILVVASAATLGDNIGYELGRYLGAEWLLKHGRRFGLRQEHLDRVQRFFTGHGGKAILAGHFMHLMRALMPFVAGASRMRHRRFFLFDAAGCTLWASTLVLLGHFVGSRWRVVAEWVGRAGGFIVAMLLLAIVFLKVRRRRQRVIAARRSPTDRA